MAKYKVGDAVIVNGIRDYIEFKDRIGTVLDISNYPHRNSNGNEEDDYLIEFNTPIANSNSTWYVQESLLKPASEIYNDLMEVLDV